MGRGRERGGRVFQREGGREGGRLLQREGGMEGERKGGRDEGREGGRENEVITKRGREEWRVLQG